MKRIISLFVSLVSTLLSLVFSGEVRAIDLQHIPVGPDELSSNALAQVKSIFVRALIEFPETGENLTCDKEVYLYSDRPNTTAKLSAKMNQAVSNCINGLLTSPDFDPTRVVNVLCWAEDISIPLSLFYMKMPTTFYAESDGHGGYVAPNYISRGLDVFENTRYSYITVPGVIWARVDIWKSNGDRYDFLDTRLDPSLSDLAIYNDEDDPFNLPGILIKRYLLDYKENSDFRVEYLIVSNAGGTAEMIKFNKNGDRVPLNPVRLSVNKVSDGKWEVILINVEPGRGFILQKSESLISPKWVDVGRVSGTMLIEVPAKVRVESAEPSMFFRVVETTPNTHFYF